MRHGMRLWWVLLALAGVMADEARADPLGLTDQRHLFEVGAYGGIVLFADPHQLFGSGSAGPRTFDDVEPTVGGRIAYLPRSWVGVELEGGATFADAGAASATVFTVRAHALLQYPRRFAPMLLAGGGVLGVSSGSDAVGDDLDGAFHWGIGFKGFVTRWLALRVDGRHLVSGDNTGGFESHFEILGGVSLVLGWRDPKPLDGDGDGVPDDEDACPEVAGEGEDGCPLDGDGDGVPDDRDACPKVAGKGKDGCPLDGDGDGVPDDKDACPKEAGKGKDGCPLDGDGDGVPDVRDACPKVAGKGKDGCPLDSDGDGIPDPDDKCPDKPETRNGYKDGDGCPDVLPKKIKKFTGVIRGITFELDKDIIRPSSFALLVEASKVLVEFKELKLLIVGHTCTTGTRPHNMDLSLRRAQAVKTYLMAHGVAAERLEVKGVGPDQPVASNKTPRGRAKNRRIEFKINN